MALTDLTPTERQQVNEFLRDYRAAMADVVRGLRRQQLLVQAYTQTIAPLWDRIADADVVLDGSGLAGAGSLTQAEIISLTAHMQGILTNYNTEGHRQMWAKAAGPGNLIG